MFLKKNASDVYKIFTSKTEAKQVPESSVVLLGKTRREFFKQFMNSYLVRRLLMSLGSILFIFFFLF